MILGHALMMFTRGVPVIYYGDEQGFTGDGGDRDARQDMFPSQVDGYNHEVLIGGASAAGDHFRTDGPLYQAISAMARIRAADPALRQGRQIVRAYGDKPGLFVISRKVGGREPGGETLVVFNTSPAPIVAQVEVDATSRAWRSVHGPCAATATAPGSYRVEIGPLDYMICVSEGGQ
jgi:glycosidase